MFFVSKNLFQENKKMKICIIIIGYMEILILGMSV